MSRVKRAVHARKTKRQYFAAAKGFTGGRRRLWRTVRNAVDRARSYAYRDRKVKKREFRGLWIIRINAACRMNGMSYSQFIHGLQLCGIGLNRKSLAHLAFTDDAAFAEICQQAKAALQTETPKAA